MAACTRGPRARKFARARVDHRYSGISPAFPAQRFTAYSALSPVNQRLPPSFPQSLWSFARAWRLHGRARTTRLRRPHPCRSSVSTACVRRLPLHVRDDRDTPLQVGAEWGQSITIFGKTKAEYFCAKGWTGQISLMELVNFLCSRRGAGCSCNRPRWTTPPTRPSRARLPILGVNRKVIGRPARVAARKPATRRADASKSGAVSSMPRAVRCRR